MQRDPPQSREGRFLPTGGAATFGRARLAGIAVPVLACILAGAAPLIAAVETPRGAGAQTAGPEPIGAIPRPEHVDPERVRLGERLFHDVRLSRGNRLACSSCHDLRAGGDDGRRLSPGIADRPLDFNTPTVFNAALSFRLNWRGNFRTFEEQAEAVLHDPAVMGTSWGELIPKLASDEAYVHAFTAAYGEGPKPAHVLDALAAFQRTLLTPDAPFDRYLHGEVDALTEQQQRGYGLFKDYGCIACHQGINVGGNLFQRFGIFDDPFSARTSPSQADLGRFTVTGRAADRHVFRVPSLRNVAETAPYFHDGRAPTLHDAVKAMARSQLGRTLTPVEVDDIVAFLGTLTGSYRGQRIAGSGGRVP